MRLSIFAFCMWLISYQAIACSCRDAAAPHSVWFNKSKSVFLARVESIRITDILGKIIGASGLSFRAKLDIVETYKGTPPENHEVSGDQDSGGNCGIDMVEGEHYLIFISEDDRGDNQVGFCDHTLQFSKDLDSPIVKEILSEMRSLHDKQRR